MPGGWLGGPSFTGFCMQAGCLQGGIEQGLGNVNREHATQPLSWDLRLAVRVVLLQPVPLCVCVQLMALLWLEAQPQKPVR